MRRFLKASLKVLALIVTLGAVAIAVLFSFLWLEHNSSLELPRPTGPFAVGRFSTAWIDTTREDPFAPAPKPKRALVVWIWYPAERSDRARTAEYLPGPWQRALAEHSGVLFMRFLFRNPTEVRNHSLDDADVATARPSYPVVIFRSGIGALACQYTALLEDLASQGYIVVGADTPYSTGVVVMPDGRVIYKTVDGNPGDAPISDPERVRRSQSLIWVWTADTKSLLDQIAHLNESDPAGRFTGKIDLNTVGVMGHSFGGATATQFCHDDSRCRAGIDLDGRLFGTVALEGVGQPFLFLLSDHGEEWTSPACTICAEIRSAAKRAPADKLIVTLLGAHHFSFGDQSLTQSRVLRSVLMALGGEGRLDPRTGLATATRYVRTFFDVHLRGAPREALYSGPLAPGVRFEAK
jgi:dienelactone hydrolase